MPAWSLSGVTKSYRQGREKVVALDRFDLAIEPHELLVVLGPAGAGKTTLLRIMAGLEQPDSGEIRCGAEDMTMAAPSARDVAMVFQNFSLYPHLSVYDNIAFALRSNPDLGTGGLPTLEIDSRVRGAAALLSLADKLDRRPGTLSGGEMQRVAIGRCLVRRPKLFLFDEPLVNLDAKLRESLRSELHRMQRETGTAMVYVTHDQAEAMTLADRLVVIDRGQVLQVGEPDWVYRQPVNARVAQLLGMPPINLFNPEQASRLGLPPGEGAFAAVRPESFVVTPNPLGGGKVLAIERMGRTDVVIVEASGQLVRAMHPRGEALRVGEPVSLTVDEVDILWLGL